MCFFLCLNLNKIYLLLREYELSELELELELEYFLLRLLSLRWSGHSRFLIYENNRTSDPSSHRVCIHRKIGVPSFFRVYLLVRLWECSPEKMYCGLPLQLPWLTRHCWIPCLMDLVTTKAKFLIILTCLMVPNFSNSFSKSLYLV